MAAAQESMLDNDDDDDDVVIVFIIESASSQTYARPFITILDSFLIESILDSTKNV